MRWPAAILLLAATMPATYGSEPAVVWWEAEAAVGHNFPSRSAFSPDALGTQAERLSGGSWLSSDGRRRGAPLHARYDVTVPEDGEFELWVRKFWKHGPFRWRFDGESGRWQTCGPDAALFDTVTLRTNVSANWVHLGKVRLTGGRAHGFEIELLADEGEEATAAFDCFVLAQGSFLPRGRLKPGDRFTAAEPGYVAFDSGIDPFRDDALLDLRHLNEPVAGQSGFLQRNGGTLTLGDGTPVRFWAMNLGAGGFEQPDVVLDYLARRLAKLGVNMVRLHGALFDESDPTKVNPRRLDGMQRAVAAFRKQGIYTTLSVYFPVWMNITPSCGLDGYDTIDNKKPFGLIFFNPRMQALHQRWLTALLTAPNPHTGVPLGQDPAVGMVEIVNEDSLFFWTFSKKHIPPAQWTVLEERFGQWLTKRDRKRRGRTELFEAWHMTRRGHDQAGGSRRKHIADQVQFLAELQREFYESTTRFLKEDLNFRGLVVASNWTTADNRLLDALERYSYTAGDVIDYHGYLDRGHEGDAASYSIRTGQLYDPVTVLGTPTWAPIRIDQIAGYPSIISEVNWTNPSPYRAEATALLAAYGALQGIDGIYHFAINDPTLVNTSMAKFSVGDASIAGTFPAAALMYRRGDVQQAHDVIRQSLRIEDLYQLKGQATGGAAPALDAFRAADVPPGEMVQTDAAEFDAHAFFVGPVTRSIAQQGASHLSTRNLGELIRRDQKRMTSLTGELTWDWGRRVMTINTPRCVAAVGFLKAHGPVTLGDVTIHCRNDYASIMVIALDDKPIAESRKLLVQAMTRERMYGFRSEPAKNAKGEDRLRITALGGPPINVEKVAATVTLPEHPWRATALDGNGYAVGETTEVRGSVALPDGSLYTIVTR